MDIQTNQSISDDQELAKVLAGVSQEADSNLQFEETGSVTPPPANPAIVVDGPADTVAPAAPTIPVPDDTTVGESVATSATPTLVADPALDDIKKTALSELRPLIGKLNVSPEEKFDTYLLLLRSTDDKDLIAPAHDAAIAIVDEARRAQALLDIIKEIDYFSNPQR